MTRSTSVRRHIRRTSTGKRSDVKQHYRSLNNSQRGFKEARKEKYMVKPFQTTPPNLNEKEKFDLIDLISSHESGTATNNETFKLYAELIKTGQINHLQGTYGRNAQYIFFDNKLITRAGIITPKGRKYLQEHGEEIN